MHTFANPTCHPYAALTSNYKIVSETHGSPGTPHFKIFLKYLKSLPDSIVSIECLCLFIWIIIFCIWLAFLLSVRLHLHFLPSPLVLSKLQLYQAKHGIEPKLNQSKVPAKGFKTLYWENKLLYREETEIWTMKTLFENYQHMDLAHQTLGLWCSTSLQI